MAARIVDVREGDRVRASQVGLCAGMATARKAILFLMACSFVTAFRFVPFVGAGCTEKSTGTEGTR